MSPEQIKGDAVDARSDLFSLGVMLFEMATGEVPFLRPTSTEMMQAIAYAKAPAIHSLRPNLPGDLQRIVSKCLEKSPADRYTDAPALVEDLRSLRRKMESGQARPVSFKERVRAAFDRLGDRMTSVGPSGYVCSHRSDPGSRALLVNGPSGCWFPDYPGIHRAAGLSAHSPSAEASNGWICPKGIASA
jgi:serine/threonine protein kinase